VHLTEEDVRIAEILEEQDRVIDAVEAGITILPGDPTVMVVVSPEFDLLEALCDLLVG